MTDPFSDPDMVACAQLVERGDPERFTLCMAAPVAARAVLFPIYACNIEISRAPWVTAEPMIAQMRLQWWLDALDEIAQGGPVRRHEVVTPLSRVLDAGGARLLQETARAREVDVEVTPFAEESAFTDYLDATAGALMQAAARALGDTDGHAARDLGWATGLALYLRAVPEFEARGRRPLAEGSHAAMVRLSRQGLDRLARARAARRNVPSTALPAFWPGWLAGPVLQRIRSDPACVAAGAVMPSPARQRARRLWVASTGRY